MATALYSRALAFFPHGCVLPFVVRAGGGQNDRQCHSFLTPAAFHPFAFFPFAFFGKEQDRAHGNRTYLWNSGKFESEKMNVPFCVRHHPDESSRYEFATENLAGNPVTVYFRVWTGHWYWTAPGVDGYEPVGSDARDTSLSRFARWVAESLARLEQVVADDSGPAIHQAGAAFLNGIVANEVERAAPPAPAPILLFPERPVPAGLFILNRPPTELVPNPDFERTVATMVVVAGYDAVVYRIRLKQVTLDYAYVAGVWLWRRPPGPGVDTRWYLANRYRFTSDAGDAEQLHHRIAETLERLTTSPEARDQRQRLILETTLEGELKETSASLWDLTHSLLPPPPPRSFFDD